MSGGTTEMVFNGIVEACTFHANNNDFIALQLRWFIHISTNPLQLLLIQKATLYFFQRYMCIQIIISIKMPESYR